MTNSKDKNYLTMAEFMQLAIRFEVESAAYYRQMQEKSAGKQAVELLRLLEKQEIEHERVLRDFPLGEDAGSILQFAPHLSLSMPQAQSADPDYDEMIEVALGREQKSVEIYRNAASMTTGSFKELLQGLANFEQEHVEKVIRLRSY